MTAQNTKFISDFRNQLTKQFVDQQQAVEDGLCLSNNRAIQLADFIVSERKERAWARSYCAKKAGLSETILYSLEMGLIPTSNIDPQWCRQLAIVFEKEITTFELILGRELPISLTFSHRLKLFRRWALVFFTSSKRLNFALGLMFITLIGWGINGLNGLWRVPKAIAFPNLSLDFFQHVPYAPQMTVVSILLIILWLFIWQGERLYQTFQQRKSVIALSMAIAFLFIIIYQLFFLLPIYFQCHYGQASALCTRQSALEQMMFGGGVLIFCATVTAVLFKFCRQIIRLLHLLQTQRKFVYCSLIISFLMMLLFFRNSSVQALMLTTAYEELANAQNQVALVETSPQENKVGLTKLWLADEATRLQAQVKWQYEYTIYAFFQFSVTIFLYTLIGIAILKKGKLLSSYSQQ